MRQKISIIQGLRLSTLVRDELSVRAYFSPSRGDKSRYYIDLKTDDAQNVGEMDVSIIESDGDKPTHLYINDMRNTSRLRHVGNALHEYAFRMSVAVGAEGRVRFDAVRNSHIFHYKNGFILEGLGVETGFVDYYLPLVKEMITSKKTGKNSTKDLGSLYLYLPQKRILENLKKYELSLDHITPKEESDYEKHRISVAEKLAIEVQQNSLAIQLILGLYDGLTIPNESEFTSIRQRLKTTDAELCKTTKNLIIDGLQLLLKQLPIDTEEKQQQFNINLIGTIICVMAYQDRRYRQQEIFNNEYLCPNIALDKIIKTDVRQSVKQLIASVGEDVLINKSLSFEKIHPKAFPSLQAIPEFLGIFEKYQLLSEANHESSFRM